MSAHTDEAERLLAEATVPTRWHWSGYKNRTGMGPYIATWIPGSGRTIVMDTVRLGMRGAQPRFNVGNRMVQGVELAVREVTYRDDITNMDHPDARLMVRAPMLLVGLLAEIAELKSRLGES